VWDTAGVLILLRHGRTAANAAGLLQGRLDQDLDDFGRQQASAAAALINERFDVAAIVSSPLRRAVQTAAALGDDVVIDDRWVELAYGRYEGAPQGDVPSEVWQRWRDDRHFTPEGGESLAVLDARVRQACEELVERAGDEDIVVVSHVSPMKTAVAWALGVEDVSFRSHLDQSAICRIAIRPTGPVLLSFNETAPLPTL